MRNQVNLELFFPKGYTPTRIQKSALEKITEAFNSEEKFIILSAPTGSGKTFLAQTISNTATQCPDSIKSILNSQQAFQRDSHGEYVYEDEFREAVPHGAFTLTITKTLQDQYPTFFPDMGILKGKSNYQSGLVDSYDVEVEHAVLPRNIVEPHQQSGRCPYCNARKDTISSQSSVLNYSMFLSLPDFVKKRNIIICDEASELENEIVQRFSSIINYAMLNKMGVTADRLRSVKSEYVRTWIFNLAGKVDTKLQKLTKRYKGNVAEVFKSKLRKLTTIKNSLESVYRHWDDCEYVVEKTETGVTLTPLKVDRLAQCIFDHAGKIILMSATIVDHKLFAKSLGIKKYKFINVESVFKPEQSPIYVSTKYKLNYKNLQRTLPYVCKQVEALLNEHKDVKGVIHTHSFNITNQFKNHFRKSKHFKRFLFREDGADNEQILSEHISSSEPTILVSPSLTDGVDLKDDLSRFQIVLKIPYLSLGSKRVKQLFKEDKKWYENKMLNNLVQACGRSTRSEEDFSVTYILDGNIKFILSNSKHKLPKHFLDRFM